MAIRGVHTMFYSDDADGLRTFLRDVIGFTDVTDVGGGWLIFNLPEADMGVHPTMPPDGSENWAKSGTMDISFYCDDLSGTIADLRAKGATVEDPTDQGFGWVAWIHAPGDFKIQLYEPKYEK